MQKEIDTLERKLYELKESQRRCNHTYGDSFKDYDSKRIPITENRPMGSDYFNPVTIGWRTEEIPVWRRKCTKCEHVQTTTNTKPVIEKHEPVFP